MENVVIIGGGPAGLSAALYLARAGLKPLVMAGSPPGGQLTLTADVENFPGHEAILGAELIEKMRRQAEKFGTRIMDKNVVKVDFSKKPFEIYLSDLGSTSKFFDASGAPDPKSAKNLMSSPILIKSAIVATGAKALWLGLESEKRLLGKGVSACATCDGFFFKGKTVAIIGGGDTALEEALTLTRFASKVYLIHRRGEFRASKVMEERVKNNPKIEIVFNTVVKEILGEKRVEGIKIKSEILNTKSQINPKSKIQNHKRLGFKNSNLSFGFAQDGELVEPFGAWDLGFRTLSLDGVFIAIGHKPDTELFKNQIERDEKGYIITSARAAFENAKSMTNNKIQNFNYNFQTMTSVEGIFAAGDCVDHVYRQAATASGMGVGAALETEKYLETIK